MRFGKFAGLIAGLLVIGALSLNAQAAAAQPKTTPSGLPVPRYVTLKFGKVNARSGPGDDHRLVWVYQAKGLPVQVVAETAEWRKVCDPEGKTAWVHKRVTDGRRAVINMTERPTPLFSKPKPDGRIAAYLERRAIASLTRCEKGWCRVKVANVSGWVRESVLWGAVEKPQCR